MQHPQANLPWDLVAALPLWICDRWGHTDQWRGGGLPKSSCNAQGIWCRFVRARRGNAWVRAKRERDPCRGQSVSPEVSRGVNGHECRTGGSTRSPASTSLLFFTGCLRWLVPEHLRAQLPSHGTQIGTGNNRRLRAKSVPLFQNQRQREGKTRLNGGRSRASKNQELWWLQTTSAVCTAEAWHQHQAPWIFSDQLNEADSTWHG